MDDYDVTTNRDVAATLAEYYLSADVPDPVRKRFEKYCLMYCNLMALGNIKRWDVPAILWAFDEVSLLYKIGLYDLADNTMARELVKMQTTRSIDGFQTLYGQHGISRTEHVEQVMARSKKKSLSGRLSGFFHKEDKTKEYPGEGSV